MSVILATETAQNKKAFVYAERLLSKARSNPAAIRPSASVKAALLDGCLFTFKINLGASLAGDKVLVMQRYAGGFVVHPQVEESYYDLAHPQEASVQLYQAGSSYLASHDPGARQFGNQYWVGDRRVFDKEEIISFHGPTNFQVGFDSSIDQPGISTALTAEVYTPFGESVYKRGKRLFSGLPAASDVIISAAYVLDNAAIPAKWLVLAVLSFTASSASGLTISEDPLVSVETPSTSKLKLYFSNDPDNKLDLISSTQDGFAASGSPIWRVLDLDATLDKLPTHAAVFSSDGLTLYVENRIFELTAGDGSFTCSENTAAPALAIAGTLVKTPTPYTLEDFGPKEFWLDGSINITGIEAIKNNLPKSITSRINIVDPISSSAFGIGSGSFSSVTTTTRSVGIATDPAVEDPTSGTARNIGRFLLSGDANIFMEYSRYLPMKFSGHSPLGIGKPVAGRFKFNGGAAIGVSYAGAGGQGATPHGKQSEIAVQGRFVIKGSAVRLVDYGRLGRFLLQGLSELEWKIAQEIYVSPTLSVAVDQSVAINVATLNNRGFLSSNEYDMAEDCILWDGTSVTGNHVTRFLGTPPYIRFTQVAHGVYTAAPTRDVVITVTKGFPTTYISAPISITYGTPLISVLSASAQRQFGLGSLDVSEQHFLVGGVEIDGYYMPTPADSPVIVVAAPVLSVDAAYDYHPPTASFGSDTAEVIVAKATLTLRFNDYSEQYSPTGISYSALEFIGYTFSGFVNGEDESVLTGSAVYEVWSVDEFGSLVAPVSVTDLNPLKSPGNYSVFVTGFSSDNYDILNPTGSLVISKIVLQFSFSVVNKSWTGAVLRPTFTVNDQGVPVPDALQYVVWSADTAGVGVYNLTATIQSEMYSGSASSTFTIRPSAVVFSNLVQTYTGFGITINPTIAPAGVSYYVLYSGTSGQSTPPVNASATPYGAQLVISHNGYSAVYNASITIQKAVPAVSLTLAAHSLNVGQTWGSTSPSVSVPEHNTDLYGTLSGYITYTPSLSSVAATIGGFLLRADYASPNPNYSNNYDMSPVTVTALTPVTDFPESITASYIPTGQTIPASKLTMHVYDPVTAADITNKFTIKYFVTVAGVVHTTTNSWLDVGTYSGYASVTSNDPKYVSITEYFSITVSYAAMSVTFLGNNQIRVSGGAMYSNGYNWAWDSGIWNATIAQSSWDGVGFVLTLSASSGATWWCAKAGTGITVYDRLYNSLDINFVSGFTPPAPEWVIWAIQSYTIGTLYGYYTADVTVDGIEYRCYYVSAAWYSGSYYQFIGSTDIDPGGNTWCYRIDQGRCIL